MKAGGKILNQEPFNELIATRLYERILEIDEYVKYELIEEEHRTVSICKNFVTRETELVPAWKINEYFEEKLELYNKSLKRNALYDEYITLETKELIEKLKEME